MNEGRVRITQLLLGACLGLICVVGLYDPPTLYYNLLARGMNLDLRGLENAVAAAFYFSLAMVVLLGASLHRRSLITVLSATFVVLVSLESFTLAFGKDMEHYPPTAGSVLVNLPQCSLRALVLVGLPALLSYGIANTIRSRRASVRAQD